ncbi:SDR family NAD(P)-dependent oxidoreductase [Pontibacter silvestris]|uniref:SDR family NAD(P)-dependent oxidoreductase n=1 Tax=Pontibacter silvestris TaxID=2305183 RepID=A0ABW4X629_9BACT|nr:SDR family oxidoreductase [Pontibacter silvestris]MCC9138350.1 SDR family oxidoreductase [Pontibacter silvestris]
MNYTLITGASRGIGEALARRCALDGHHLILVARSRQKLEALAIELHQTYNVRTQVVPLDLLQPQATLQLWQICKENKWRVRILINNAGFGYWGVHSEAALANQMEVLRLNAEVLVEMCHLFVPLLQKEKDAHILNMGSISSYQPVPYFSMYSASKAFVLSYSRSLRVELKPLTIGVSCLCPGFTQSSFFEKAGTAPLISSSKFQMKAETVADEAVRAMKKNQAVIVPGLAFKLCTCLSRFLPVSLTTYVLNKFFRPATLAVKVEVA